MQFWNFKSGAEGEPAELRISGKIVDDGNAWIYEWFDIPAASPNRFREELRSFAGQDLVVWVDSWGGDVTAGAGIYNALKNHNGKITVKVDGKAVSAASVIAMAGDEILMSPAGLMMIHNPWTEAQGDANEMRQVANVLDVVKDTIINAYQLKTKKPRDVLAKMMDGETWMSAQTAKEEGFVDGILFVEPESERVLAKNSFIFNRVALQNSAFASLNNFISQQKTKKIKEDKELTINSIDDLKNEKPDLVNQLKEEAIKAERDRVLALDKLNDSNNLAICDLVNEAKETGKTAEDILSFVNILKKHAGSLATAAENNKGEQFFCAMVTDNQASGVEGAKATGSESRHNNPPQNEINIDLLSNAINKCFRKEAK